MGIRMIKTVKLSAIALLVATSTFHITMANTDLASGYYGNNQVDYNAIYGGNPQGDSQPQPQQAVGTPQVQPQTFNPNANNNTYAITQPQAPVKELPVVPASVTSKINKKDKAFEQAKNKSLGFTPEQIRSYSKASDEREKALAESKIQDAVPYNGVKNVSLENAGNLNVIRVAFGYQTAFTFIDEAGNPWCVSNRPNSTPLLQINSLNKCSDNSDGYSFSVQPLSKFGKTNLVFSLVGEKLPIVLNFVPDQNVRDENIILRLDRTQPGTMTESEGLPAAPNAELEEYLSNTPPAHAKKLIVSGNGIDISKHKAWYADGHIYLRTPHSLKGQWISRASSVNMKIYKIKPMSSVRVEINDRLVPIRIQGW